MASAVLSNDRCEGCFTAISVALFTEAARRSVVMRNFFKKSGNVWPWFWQPETKEREYDRDRRERKKTEMIYGLRVKCGEVVCIFNNIINIKE